MRCKSSLLLVALIISLGFNGIALLQHYPDWKFSKHSGNKPHSFLNAIPEEKRQAFLKDRKANAGYFRENAKKMRELRAELLALLSAEKFSATAYKNKWDEILALQSVTQQKRIEPLVTLAGNLSPEERKTMAEQLKRPRQAWKTKTPEPKQQ